MKQLYWNIDPEKVVKQNEKLKSIDTNIQLKKYTSILCNEYKKNQKRYIK